MRTTLTGEILMFAGLATPVVHTAVYYYLRWILFQPMKIAAQIGGGKHRVYIADCYVLLIQLMVVGAVIVSIQPPSKGQAGYDSNNPPLPPEHLLTVIGLFNAVPIGWWYKWTRDLSAARVYSSMPRLFFLLTAIPLAWMAASPLTLLFLGPIIFPNKDSGGWDTHPELFVFLALGCLLISFVGARLLCAKVLQYAERPETDARDTL